MSFQHFRLGELAMGQPLPPHLLQHQAAGPLAGAPQSQPNSAAHFTGQLQNNTNSLANNNSAGHTSSTPKPPYGSGDTDDGYTLIFPNLDAFHEWRTREEESQMVEFVKGDTHGSKAVPPRFKDHTKLVCARHSRSGRKKYVKKHPERVRKVPSRKLEGQGCSASISYKTYFDTDEVRACYISQHSHEIGLANLPFTRRGRKAAVEQEKERPRKQVSFGEAGSSNSIASPDTNATAGPSNPGFSSAVSMLAPLPHPPSFPQPPPQHQYAIPQLGYPQPQPQPQVYAPPPPPPPPANNPALSHERWENMTTLFNSVRQHARSFEYPTVSVAALETVLIRLYLESPVGMGGQPSMTALLQNGAMQQGHVQMQAAGLAQNVANQNQANGTGASNGNVMNGSANASGSGEDSSGA